VFRGQLQPIGNTGMTVISDIDDTIKMTRVDDRNLMLRNTFLEEFKPVEGIAEVFQTWHKTHAAHVCYVSASPWQLYDPLVAFLQTNRFPSGTICLQNFRLKDETALNVFQKPGKFKAATIEPLLKRWPMRKFVLVGDSGQEDPEVYGSLARKFPNRVAAIFIRNVTSERPHSDRYALAFKGVPKNIWQVFTEPSELPAHLPGLK
jgi:phosphatidate phosphatase APP1